MQSGAYIEFGIEVTRASDGSVEYTPSSLQFVAGDGRFADLVTFNPSDLLVYSRDVLRFVVTDRSGKVYPKNNYASLVMHVAQEFFSAASASL